MPMRWATLFRFVVLGALMAHELVMYRLARTMEGSGLNDGFEIALACLFALAMLVPLVWAVTLPELPEIVVIMRAKRWHRDGRCPACGYRIGSATIRSCPECGASIAPPRDYAVTSATIWRYVAFNLIAWALGCGLGELSMRLASGDVRWG
jgi:hypothetical protein